MKTLVVAVDHNGRPIPVNKWMQSAHREIFRRVTCGSFIVVGYNAWKELPPELTTSPHHAFHVITANHSDELEGGRPEEEGPWTVFKGWENVNILIDNHGESPTRQVVFAGGASVFHQALANQQVDRIFLTRIPRMAGEGEALELEDVTGWVRESQVRMPLHALEEWVWEGGEDA